MMRFQLVRWFPEWQGFGFRRTDFSKTDMALIYEWYLWLGWWEVRKWRNRRDAVRMLDERNKRESIP